MRSMLAMSRYLRSRREGGRALGRLYSCSPPAAAADVPDAAETVVVGGGIIGASVAYHLAKHGARDVLLLERDKITSGTTWHAAGLMVTFGSTSETSTSLRKYSKELYASVLEEETGQSTGFKPCGFIELATHPDRVEEFRRVSAFNRKCGVDVHEISAEQVKSLFPACRTDDVLRGFYVEDDGRVNPYDATMTLVKGARMRGVRVMEDTPVSGVTKSADGSRVTGVTLADGREIRAETVVNCAGMWARQFGEKAGVVVPNQAAEHYYLVTDPIDEVSPDWPVIEDPSAYTYIRPEGAGLMVGLLRLRLPRGTWAPYPRPALSLAKSHQIGIAWLLSRGSHEPCADLTRGRCQDILLWA